MRHGAIVDLGEGQPAVIGRGSRVVPVEPRGQRSDAGHPGIPGAHPDRVAVVEPILVLRPGRHRCVGADPCGRQERDSVVGAADDQELARLGCLALIAEVGVHHEQILVVGRKLEADLVIAANPATGYGVEAQRRFLSAAAHVEGCLARARGVVHQIGEQ